MITKQNLRKAGFKEGPVVPIDKNYSYQDFTYKVSSKTTVIVTFESDGKVFPELVVGKGYVKLKIASVTSLLSLINLLK